jgi:hypothetical protein
VTNNTAIFIADNKKLKADNLKLIHEVSQLNGNIEELEQYGRRTSLRFHNVQAMLDLTCSFSWLFSFSRHFILF